MRRRDLCALLCLFAGMASSGCAMVTVTPLSPTAYRQSLRDDALHNGRLGQATVESLQVLGIDRARCERDSAACVQRLLDSTGLTQEQRLSAAAELALLQALKASAGSGAGGSDAALDAWLRSARYAYAYLFFSERAPNERAFEDRQTQIRDYYNYATERIVAAVFQRLPTRAAGLGGAAALPAPAPWRITLQTAALGPPAQLPKPQALLPATSLRFGGLRNVYRRDGFGTAMVAVLPPTSAIVPPAATAEMADSADIVPGTVVDMQTPNVTVVLRFHGDRLADVLGSAEVTLEALDPLHDVSARFGAYQVPLAGNFTAGYGVWLARAGFAQRSVQNFFDLGQGSHGPQVFMLQPYDPNRRVLLLLHGLVSSPDAWVNVANEILGDAALRARYQIWLAYYPTNLPLPYTHLALRRTIEQALRRFDPAGTHAASHDMVLVGHSMGGILARLMVSSSHGDALWQRLFGDLPAGSAEAALVRRKLGPLLEFEPMPAVGRAVFIAAPQRGTPVANGALVGMLRALIELPAALRQRYADVAALAGARPGRLPTSLDNLRDTDPFIQAAAALSIQPAVPFHSIIARRNARGPLADASDGLVPYRSAHLEGAQSETVIVAGHSVQERPAAILELRRILRLHVGLPDLAGTPAPAGIAAPAAGAAATQP
ncbi:esterase/lipase family protein [Xanthomonas maliensis]|uniref:esterase/lipase family protein n=1 Tax=Xanthomonas maliensis TaxID=1321368 RepID=UPI0003A607FC|nr:alpha/beta hydrolase [Xanthomonas maliensis]